MKLLFRIFLLPGIIVSWVEYMFPKRGDVWASGRRVDSRGIHILYSLGGWFIICLFLMHQFVPERLAEFSQRLRNPQAVSANSDAGMNEPKAQVANVVEDKEDVSQLLESEDWAPIHDIIAKAYSLGGVRQVLQWRNLVNGHQGNVFQSGIGQDEQGCRQFRITQNDGSIRHVEYCADGSIH